MSLIVAIVFIVFLALIVVGVAYVYKRKNDRQMKQEALLYDRFRAATTGDQDLVAFPPFNGGNHAMGWMVGCNPADLIYVGVDETSIPHKPIVVQYTSPTALVRLDQLTSAAFGGPKLPSGFGIPERIMFCPPSPTTAAQPPPTS
jgi:hypothetical protein